MQVFPLLFTLFYLIYLVNLLEECRQTLSSCRASTVHHHIYIVFMLLYLFIFCSRFGFGLVWPLLADPLDATYASTVSSFSSHSSPCIATSPSPSLPFSFSLSVATAPLLSQRVCSPLSSSGFVMRLNAPLS